MDSQEFLTNFNYSRNKTTGRNPLGILRDGDVSAVVVPDMFLSDEEYENVKINDFFDRFYHIVKNVTEEEKTYRITSRGRTIMYVLPRKQFIHHLSRR